jgi:hypothetical protein
MTPDRWSLPAWVDAVETRRRRPPSSDAARVNGERTRLRRHHTALWLVAIVLSAAIVLPILWKAMAIPDSNPRLLLGTWKTTTAKYRDRSFEIWPTTLVFQTGPGENDFTVHQVDKVDVSVRGDSTLDSPTSSGAGSPGTGSSRRPPRPDGAAPRRPGPDGAGPVG